MAFPPAFVPRELLEVPGYFGVQRDVTWRLADDVAGAIRLARAREQHVLAYAVHLLRLRYDNSIPDMADRLGQRREGLWRKLTERQPAQEEDLILWCWLAGESRRSYQPDGLVSEPIAMPRFLMLRRQER